MRRPLVSISFLATLWFGVPALPAPVQAADDAEKFTQQGLRYMRAGDDERARVALVRAYKLAPNPRRAGQLGMCEMNLARWIDAEAHLGEALAATKHPWVVENQAVLVQFIAKAKDRLGWVEITGRPDGAEVEVAGKAVGVLPLTSAVRVVTGDVFLRVAAPGHRTVRRTVRVQANQRAQVTFDLEKIPQGAVAKAAEPAVDQPAVDDLAADNQLAERVTNPPSDVPQGPPWRRTGAWVAAGSAALLAGVGGMAVLFRDSRYEEFNTAKNSSGDLRCNERFPNNGGKYCNALLTQGKQWTWAAIGGFSLAGVAAVMSVYWFATAPNGGATAQAPPRGLALSACGPTVTGLGAGCAFTF